jgi:hypothetical protein
MRTRTEGGEVDSVPCCVSSGQEAVLLEEGRKEEGCDGVSAVGIALSILSSTTSHYTGQKERRRKAAAHRSTLPQASPSSCPSLSNQTCTIPYIKAWTRHHLEAKPATRRERSVQHRPPPLPSPPHHHPTGRQRLLDPQHAARKPTAIRPPPVESRTTRPIGVRRSSTDASAWLSTGVGLVLCGRTLT